MKNGMSVAKSPTFFVLAIFCKFDFCPSLLFTSLKKNRCRKFEKVAKVALRGSKSAVFTIRLSRRVLKSYHYIENFMGRHAPPSAPDRMYSVTRQLPYASLRSLPSFPRPLSVEPASRILPNVIPCPRFCICHSGPSADGEESRLGKPRRAALLLWCGVSRETDRDRPGAYVPTPDFWLLTSLI